MNKHTDGHLVVLDRPLLLCSMARIYDLWDGSLDKCKVRGLVPCWDQDGYRAKEKKEQHPNIFCVY